MSDDVSRLFRWKQLLTHANKANQSSHHSLIFVIRRAQKRATVKTVASTNVTPTQAKQLTARD